MSTEFTCDFCGKNFPADARACVESGIGFFPVLEEGEEWKETQPVALSRDLFNPALLEQIKHDLQINDTQLNQLFETGSLEGLGSIICIECQDKME